MRFTKQEISQIEELYKTGKYTCQELGLMFGRCKSAVSANFRYRKIKVFNDQTKIQKKYTLNEHYFDKIDTEGKAYFLGLLYADGCNSEENNSVIIGLQERDEHILNSFKEELGTNAPLAFINLNKKNPNWSNSLKLSIHSKHMSQTLSKIGCHKKKSLTLKFPTNDIVPDSLLRHFVRGYFDGDGSFGAGYGKKPTGTLVKRYHADIVSTESFCLEIQKILRNFGISNYLSGKNDHVLNGNNITKNIRGSGPYVFKFLDWMYKDSKFHLNRKKNKYEAERDELLNKAKNNPRYARYLGFLS